MSKPILWIVIPCYNEVKCCMSCNIYSSGYFKAWK